MKIFFVTILILSAIIILILGLDFILGFHFSELVRRLKKPYEVPEASEYMVIIGFISFFMIKFIFSYFKKKKGNNPSAN